eukprot:COSAG02_NODE_10296_length_1975_cov_3.396055_1_plen_254_part_00
MRSVRIAAYCALCFVDPLRNLTQLLPTEALRAPFNSFPQMKFQLQSRHFVRIHRCQRCAGNCSLTNVDHNGLTTYHCTCSCPEQGRCLRNLSGAAVHTVQICKLASCIILCGYARVTDGCIESSYSHSRLSLACSHAGHSFSSVAVGHCSLKFLVAAFTHIFAPHVPGHCPARSCPAWQQPTTPIGKVRIVFLSHAFPELQSSKHPDVCKKHPGGSVCWGTSTPLELRQLDIDIAVTYTSYVRESSLLLAADF